MDFSQIRNSSKLQKQVKPNIKQPVSRGSNPTGGVVPVQIMLSIVSSFITYLVNPKKQQ